MSKLIGKAEKIWKDVSGLEVSLFALPPKKLSELCEPMPISDKECYLSYSISALLPALEEALKAEDKYECEMSGRFIVVKDKGLV